MLDLMFIHPRLSQKIVQISRKETQANRGKMKRDKFPSTNHHPPFFFFLFCCGFLLVLAAPPLPLPAAAASGVGVAALPLAAVGGGEAATGDEALGIAPAKQVETLVYVVLKQYLNWKAVILPNHSFRTTGLILNTSKMFLTVHDNELFLFSLIGKKVEVSLRLFDIFKTNRVFIF